MTKKIQKRTHARLSQLAIGRVIVVSLKYCGVSERAEHEMFWYMQFASESCRETHENA